MIDFCMQTGLGFGLVMIALGSTMAAALVVAASIELLENLGIKLPWPYALLIVPAIVLVGGCYLIGGLL